MIYYLLAGLIADPALILNLLFMLAALSLFRATQTLSGIAGIDLLIVRLISGHRNIHRSLFHNGLINA